jgi:hypothetical protein
MMAIIYGNNVKVTFGGVEISAFNCNVPTKNNSSFNLELSFTPKILSGTGEAMTPAEKRKFDDFINELESK